ncbi:fimbrial protein [Serratia fonticola]
MNKKKLTACLLAQAALLYAGYAPAQGQINVTGRILDNTCVVSVASQNQTVQMQEEGNKTFFRPGDTGTTNPFQVVLERCGAAAKGVTLNFQGTGDTRDPRLLSTGTGPGRASGVGIGLYERDGTAIALNTDTRKYVLTGGAPRVALNYDARYVAVAVPVTPGRAAGAVTFTHTYD